MSIWWVSGVRNLQEGHYDVLLQVQRTPREKAQVVFFKSFSAARSRVIKLFGGRLVLGCTLTWEFIVCGQKELGQKKQFTTWLPACSSHLHINATGLGNVCSDTTRGPAQRGGAHSPCPGHVILYICSPHCKTWVSQQGKTAEAWNIISNNVTVQHCRFKLI